MRIGLGLSIVGQQVVPSFTGILDTYSGAAAAYSVRRLSGSYSGSAIRVRESSGGTEADIGFDASGNLDETALLSHCGANDGFVTKWYDQSGNGYDAIQATAGSQPKIVNAGTVVKENGLPALDYDNTDDYMNTSAFASLSNASYFIVSKLNIGSGSNDYSYIFSTEGSTYPLQGLSKFHNFGADANKRYVFDGSNVRLDGVNSLSQELASLFFPTSSPYINLYINTTSQSFSTSPASALSPTNKYITIGRYDGLAVNYLDGKIQEFIVYASDQSANRSGIEANINAYFSIYP